MCTPDVDGENEFKLEIRTQFKVLLIEQDLFYSPMWPMVSVPIWNAASYRQGDAELLTNGRKDGTMTDFG